MSYLFPLGSTTEQGVVEVGSNISVDVNAIISIPQSVATSASVTFDTISFGTAPNVIASVLLLVSILI